MEEIKTCDPRDIGAFLPIEDIWLPRCAAVPIGLNDVLGAPRLKPDDVPGIAPKSTLIKKMYIIFRTLEPKNIEEEI